MNNETTRKIAIATGGSRGLGRNTVLNLAKRGVDSILTYNFNRREAEKVAASVAEAGQRAVALKLDAGSAAYGSMKGAVEVLTRYLAKELGSRRITVNVVAPGAIETDFSGGLVRDNLEINMRIADTTALGRVGLPDDIGPMIASLLSEDNRWVDAQRIEVSGGQSI
ncbi:MAG: SDR family oxidoreductase [Acetobacteraceae bacterium]